MKTAELLDPGVFLAVEDLELVGRGLAESVWLGRHGASRGGPGTEFLRHRPYVAGDDLRRVNWALFARHRQLFTKESRLETIRPVYLLIDATGSMSVANGPWSKLHYAVRVAAGLAWLAACQGDSTALALLRDGLEGVVEPGGGQRHFAGICASLAGAETGGAGDWDRIFGETGKLCRKPGFVVWVSDFFNREDETLRHLAMLKAGGHDVMALHLLDPVETELPEKGDFKFTDPETGGVFRTSAEPLRASYAREVAGWRQRLRQQALNAGLLWTAATTADPLAPVLRAWLDERGG
jgi:uncharacterized protein (DUF58 family)